MNRIYNYETKDLRNRSSKNLILLQGVKPAFMSMPNNELSKFASNGNKDAIKEQNRRAKKRDKKNK